MKRRSNPLPYLFLNIIVSAATTLGVLFAWEALRKPPAPPPAAAAPEAAAPAATGAVAAGVNTPAASGAVATPEATATNPPPGQTVIEIAQVVGAGDLEQEVVLLRRLGEGNLTLTGWRLRGDGGSEYRFPEQPALVLYKDGAVHLYTRLGADTVTDLYWNRAEPAWRPGETLTLFDEQGSERAQYRIP
jgi:hypothetical protein